MNFIFFEFQHLLCL